MNKWLSIVLCGPDAGTPLSEADGQPCRHFPRPDPVTNLLYGAQVLPGDGWPHLPTGGYGPVCAQLLWPVLLYGAAPAHTMVADLPYRITWEGHIYFLLRR